MMERITKYLESSEMGRFLVVCIPIFVILLGIGIYLNPINNMKIIHNCEKLNQTEDYCTFLCKYKTNLNSVGRVLITHTSWSSIYESGDFDIDADEYKHLEIQLPNRNFEYYMRAGFYNISNGVKYYGVSEGSIKC